MVKKQAAYLDVIFNGTNSAAVRLSSADKVKELREILDLPETINKILKEEEENGRRN